MESTLALNYPVSNYQDFSIDKHKPSFECILDSNLMTMADKPKRPINITEISKTKRIQVKNACVNCQKACKKCDDGRPCQRCIKYDLVDTCRNSVRKTRKKGVKRGSYRRKSIEKPKSITPISVISGKKETMNENLNTLTFASSELQQQTMMAQLPNSQDVNICYSALPDPLECYTTSKNETDVTSYISSSLLIPHEDQMQAVYPFCFSFKNQNVIVPPNDLEQSSSLNSSVGFHQANDDTINLGIGQKVQIISEKNQGIDKASAFPPTVIKGHDQDDYFSLSRKNTVESYGISNNLLLNI